jgi:hypothetical protein
MGQDREIGQGADPEMTPDDIPFAELRDRDLRVEQRLFWKEIALLCLTAIGAAVFWILS